MKSEFMATISHEFKTPLFHQHDHRYFDPRKPRRSWTRRSANRCDAIHWLPAASLLVTDLLRSVAVECRAVISMRTVSLRNFCKTWSLHPWWKSVFVQTDCPASSPTICRCPELSRCWQIWSDGIRLAGRNNYYFSSSAPENYKFALPIAAMAFPSRHRCYFW